MSPPTPQSGAADPITVTPSPSKNPHAAADAQLAHPAHWVDRKGASFTNPWPSWRWIKYTEIFRTAIKMARVDMTPDPKVVTETMHIRTPTFGASPPSSSSPQALAVDPDTSIKATWLGHACFLVEFPSHGTPAGKDDLAKGVKTRGVRILFDPVFSDRCSPVGFMGPKRYTQPPCKLEDLPEVDAIVISHNHYDHLDTASLKTLLTRSAHIPHIFAPLGNGPLIKSLGVPDARAHIMDWWDSKHLEISVPSSSQSTQASEGSGKAKGTTASSSETETVLGVDITCTPSQHFSGRMWRDNFKTLWASWVVEDTAPLTRPSSSYPPSPTHLPLSKPFTSKKVFFGGDTGYRTVPEDKDENDVPYCPAFKDIGAVFGGIDLALLPIGAYSPRPYMSPVHCSPSDSVRIYQDVKAKKGLGMHWGTFVLTAEPFTEPPQLLKTEVKKAGIPEDDFTVCEIGETVFF